MESGTQHKMTVKQRMSLAEEGKEFGGCHGE